MKSSGQLIFLFGQQGIMGDDQEGGKQAHQGSLLSRYDNEPKNPIQLALADKLIYNIRTKEYKHINKD